MPPPEVQRKARSPPEVLLTPTMTEPSPETPVASLSGLDGRRKPMPEIPPAAVQRKASAP